MKKILHICIFERYVENASYQENVLAVCHKNMGNEVYIIASQTSMDYKKCVCYNSPSHYINKYGIDVTILKNKKHIRFFSAFSDHCYGLYEKLVDISPNIIFVHNFTSKDVRHIVKYAHEHPEVSIYADCHSDYYNNPLSTLLQKFRHCLRGIWGRSLCKVSKKMWGTTPWRVEYLQDVYRIPTEKTGLLIMGADERLIIGKDRKKIRDEVRQLYEIPDNAFLVVTGGTLDKRKQQDILFDAIKDLKCQNVWLLAFGSPTKEMEPIFEKYKEVHNIVMTGWLPAERAYDLFMASELAFFPGTHSVLWEQAVACSTPLVVRHWGGMEHVNVNGNAILLDNVTTSTIKETIVKLNNTTKYKEMVSSAKDIASQFFLTEIAKRAIGQN